MEQRLIDFFERHLKGFDPRQPLTSQMDSLQIFTLIPILEKEFSVRISSMEITSQTFQSITNLARLLDEKRG